MTRENDLGPELLRRGGNDEGGATAAAETAAAAVDKRDRRRIRLLAAATVGSWLLAAILIPAVLMPLWAKVRGGDAGDPRGVTPDVALQSLAIVATYIAAVSTAASLLAATCTVWLVLTVRRSTLRQVAAGLARISDQLAALQNADRATRG